MPDAVIHFEVSCANTGRAKEFYSQLFGWEMNDLPDVNYTMVIADPSEGINGGIREEADPARRGILIYVEVDDLQESLDRAIGLGATVVQPSREIPGVVTLAVLTDPEGNRIGLVKSHTDGAVGA